MIQNFCSNIVHLVVFGNTIGKYIIALGLFVLLFIVVKIGQKVALKILGKLSGIEKLKLGVVFVKYLVQLPVYFWIAVELYIASRFLILSENVSYIINLVLLVVVIFEVCRIIIKTINFFLVRLLHTNKTGQQTVQTLVNIVVWAFGIMIFLSNIGVNLTPLIASLGVASIAVAFALQNILSDLFSSFSILISKPFLVGDYIAVGDTEGTVNSITLKSTNLTNVAGQEVVIPNSTILSSKVVNFGKMKFRRERITIGVVYSTGLKYLKEIPDIIGGVIGKIDGVDFDWCYLKSLNDFSIDFLYSYQIHSPDLVDGLKINEKIYIGILDEFAKKGIDIAFPSQTIYTYNSDYNYKENPPK